MPLPLIVPLAASLAPTIFKGIFGANQLRDAKNINPVDPNYQTNTGIIDNARILQDRYGNYTMPGYNQAKNNIGSSYASMYDKGVQGATSSNDVLDLATKLAYGQGQSLNQLEAQNAQGKEAALGQYLNANAMAGQEAVNANAYDRDMYQGQLREKASLQQAGTENLYGALDTGGAIAGAYLNPRKYLNTGTSTGKAAPLGSIY